MKKTLIIISMLLYTGFVFGNPPVYIDKAGEGKPILFLPGFTTPGSVWDETIENLTGDYETYQVSYAGFNGLAPIDTPWYESIRRHLIEYVSQSGLTELTIVGHSMGGNFAVELAAELDEQVVGLILVDALPCMREVMMPGVPATSISYNSPYNNNMLAMSSADFEQFAANMARNMNYNESKMEELSRWSIEADRKTYIYGYTELLKLDLRPRLSEVQTNTLILGATFPTKEMTEQTFQKQYANLPNKTIALADDSKHFIMFDQPEWFYKQINTYLEENDR
ncbi:MAG TPA: alpha/beta hydrolase [Cytophagales bacterium]|jgi:pimeloyl-ACP methyl ester carboxylesterase|nr:alpha/beta hydrolase [Cytophagales bacterium]